MWNRQEPEIVFILFIFCKFSQMEIVNLKRLSLHLFNVFLFSWFFFSFFDFFFYFLPVFSLKKCSWKLFCLSWKKKICKKNVKTEIKIIFPWCEKLKIPDGIFLFEEKTNSGEFVKKCRRIFLPCVKLWFHV